MLVIELTRKGANTMNTPDDYRDIVIQLVKELKNDDKFLIYLYVLLTNHFKVSE